jgi:hypothetical protein
MAVNRPSLWLMVFILFFIPSCCLIPVGHSSYGRAFYDQDLTFIKLGVTTKSEIVERLGEGFYSEEYNVITYNWKSTTDFIWFVPVGYGPGGDWTYRQNYGLYVQFDSNGHVKRFQRMQLPDNGLTIKEWLDRE